MEAKTANTVDDPSSTRFTWRIDNFSTLNTQKLYSESFYVGGYKWRVLIFPKGSKNSDNLGIYLDVADSETLPYGWTKYIKFSLSVINHINNKTTVKIDAQHQFHAQESGWGFASFMPFSKLCDPGRGYLVNDTCVVEVDFPGFRSVELRVEEVKTALAKGETTKSSSQGDIDGSTTQTASGTDTILPQTDTLSLPPASESATEVIKTLVPPTTPIVEKESTVNSPHAQDPEVELPRSTPMDAPLESISFGNMDAYISKLVSVLETDAPFDSTTEGSVVSSIPQSTIDEAKKFFIKMLSKDLSEIPDFAAHITESMCVLSECHDLTPAQLAQLNALKVEFPSVLKTLTSNHSLKEVRGKNSRKARNKEVFG
ncbi:MATH domain and coiled-coil domain-containing protein At2g42460-like [Cornus florida]|uniref:MATH domain and coiled-coil domain-containing protein At2g42460-like n=1 Tax=Cornus florida TaxID=4283 RepID=UPI0028A2A484|nr:MATH domain and coiled-coil domain-containing protein At2g42460-like [Cornus florida]